MSPTSNEILCLQVVKPSTIPFSMTLYYHYTYEQHQSFEIYKQRHQQFVSFTLYHNLSGIAEYIHKSGEDEHVLLLDESAFDVFQFDCVREGEEWFSIHDLNTVIQSKQQEIKNQYRPSSNLLYHTIDMMYHDGEETTHLIWHTGILLWKISFVYIKQHILTILRQSCSLALMEHIRIYPQTFFTIGMLKDTLQKTRFVYLRISDTHIKLIECERGCYKQLATVSLWINTLKDIYKEHEILPLLYKSLEQVQENPYALTIVTSCIQFYVRMICKRIKEIVWTDIDIIVSSSLMKQWLFVDELYQAYHEHINGYVLPFSLPHSFKYFGQERSSEDTDIVTYLNSEQKIRHITHYRYF